MTGLARIYTRRGDGGQTQLPGGRRVPKHAQRLECLGAVDELSACIGLARALLQRHAAPAGLARLAARLGGIQKELSGLCADLATSATAGQHIAARDVTVLERNIDTWPRRLSPLRTFILPGEEKIKFGITRDVNSHDPFVIWAFEFKHLLVDFVHAPGLAEKAKVLFGKPGETYSHKGKGKALDIAADDPILAAAE